MFFLTQKREENEGDFYYENNIYYNLNSQQVFITNYHEDR